MRISKSVLVVCAAATTLCVPGSLRSEDTEAQAKAREALRNKLGDMQAPAAAQTQAPAKPVSQPIATPQTVAAPQPAATPIAPPPPADSDALAKAREAMRKRLNEVMPTEQPAAPAVVETPAPKQPAATTAAPAAVAQPEKPAPVAAPAADPASIVKAREALRKRMGEETAATAKPAAAPITTAPATTSQPAATTAAPAAIAQPEKPAPVAAPAADPASIVKAREALRKRMGEETAATAKPAAAPTTTAPATTSQPAVATAPAATPKPEVAAPAATTAAPAAVAQPEKPAPVAAPAADPAAVEKARAAMREKLSQVAPAEVPTKPEAVGRVEAERKARANTGAFKPLDAPPSPFSAEKQQRLAELLRKYKADEITSVEYHRERAKIIAEQ